jgi:uncharacterized membrane protein YhaH (DUF805 family)
MTFADAIRTCFRKYVTFSGRATRPEYWYFILFLFLGGIVTSTLDSILFGASENLGVTHNVTTGESSTHVEVSSGDGPISAIFSFGTLLPMLAAGWRRMHDTGRSGLYLLYPILVWFGIGTFASFAGLTGPLLSGDFLTAFSGLVGIIMLLSVIVAILSPLIVIWWLTRPTQPGPNDFGPNPNEVSP